MKSLASLFLILTLCLWPAEMIFARLDDADIEDMRDDDGDEEGGESEAEQDSDHDGSPDTEEAETSAANAAEVSEVASAAGLSASDIGEIGSINTTEDANVPNDGVSIGGTTMTKDQALEAIKSIAEAKSKGIGASKDPNVPGIDVQATLAAHAQGERGVVVGSITGEIDTPEVIAHKEIDAAVSIKNVSSAASLSTSPTAGYVNGAKNVSDAVLSAAYNQAAKSMTQAGVLSISGRTKQVTAYQELARTGTAAGITNIGGTTNTIYSYDPNTNKFTGQQNGMSFDKIPGAAGSELDKTFTDILSKAGNESTITVDLNKGVTSVTNVRTGLVTNYTNATGNFVAPSLNSPLFSPELTAGAPTSLTQVTGSINLFQGVPINAISVEQKAQQLNAMNLVTVGELDPKIREKIARGEALTSEEMAAVMAVHGSLANRAAATNRTYASFAYQDRIISSISVDKKAFDNWKALTDEQKTNVQNFNENLMSGNFYTGKAGFTSYTTKDAVVVPNATHFHTVDTTPVGWSITKDQPTATLGGHIVGQVYTANGRTLEYSRQGQKADTYTVVTTAPTSYDAVVALSKDKVSGLSQSSITPRSVDSKEGVGLSEYGHGADTPNPNNPGSSGEYGRIFEEQGNAQIRKGSITDELYQQLEYAAKRNGVDVHIYSGGQPSAEEVAKHGGKRTGSVRHDHGNAADIYLTKDGKVLDMTKAEDRAVMKSFFTDAVAAGANGIGAAVGYMGKNGMHVGGGSQLAWGAGGASATAERWVKDALSDGLSQRGSVDLKNVTPRTSSPRPSEPVDSNASRPSAQPRNTGSEVGRTAGQVIGGAVGGPIGSVIGSFLGERIGRDINIDLGNTPGNLSGSDRKTQDSPDYGNDRCDQDKTSSTSSCPELQSQTYAQKATSFVRQAFNGSRSSPASIQQSENGQPVNEQKTVIVDVTIDDQNGLIRLSREDVVSELIENLNYRSTEEINETLSSLNDNSLVLNDEGKIVYSDGLYSPVVQDGLPVETGDSVAYSYVVKHIDENGHVVNVADNANALSESFATRFIKDLFSSKATFTKADVDKVTYRLVNPKAEVPSDEYYDYVIVLKDGSYRATTVPQFTSVAFMASRFKDIGYQGEVMDLLGGAEETTEQAIGQNILKKLVDTVKDWAGKFMETIGVTNDEKLPEEFANLPGFNSGVTSADIRSVFIYPNAAVECPDIPDYNKGYAYVAVINSRDNENHLTTITTGRCGTGDIATLVTETAKNLAEEYGISDVTYDSIKDKTFVRGEQIFYTPSIVEIDISPTTPKPNESAETPIPQDDEGKPLFIPNTTNTLTMEVKAVDSKGQVISDWKQVESIELASGTQLFFRWNGSDYQQCLPFLQDGGNYALTRQDRTMLNGNTETEGYNVTERNGTYRVECGGQKNNEYGVDERKVEIIVR